MTHPYASAAYALSLAHWGEAVEVPEWGTHVIVRPIPGGGMDAAGTYPIAVLAPDADLAGGLDRLRRLGLVSVTLVLDPVHHPPLAAIAAGFDVLRAFKTHFLHRPGRPFAYGRYHARKLRRAARSLRTGPFALGAALDEWAGLYATLRDRHRLAGVHDLQRSHAEALARLPGVTAIGAWEGEVLVSAHLWVVADGWVHSHLTASSEAGYRLGAAYAVNDASIRHFAAAEAINLGGGAGPGDVAGDGLAAFKRGFANDSAPAHLAGSILDPARYAALCAARPGRFLPDFFPAYRAPPV